MYKAVCLSLLTDIIINIQGTLEAFELFMGMNSEKIFKNHAVSHFRGVFVCV